MRLSIIITFAIIYLVASGDRTETYKCADELELDTCYLKKATETEITYYLKACKKGKTWYNGLALLPGRGRAVFRLETAAEERRREKANKNASYLP